MGWYLCGQKEVGGDQSAGKPEVFGIPCTFSFDSIDVFSPFLWMDFFPGGFDFSGGRDFFFPRGGIFFALFLLREVDYEFSGEAFSRLIYVLKYFVFLERGFLFLGGRFEGEEEIIFSFSLEGGFFFKRFLFLFKGGRGFVLLFSRG